MEDLLFNEKKIKADLPIKRTPLDAFLDNLKKQMKEFQKVVSYIQDEEKLNSMSQEIDMFLKDLVKRHGK